MQRYIVIARVHCINMPISSAPALGATQRAMMTMFKISGVERYGPAKCKYKLTARCSILGYHTTSYFITSMTSVIEVLFNS